MMIVDSHDPLMFPAAKAAGRERVVTDPDRKIPECAVAFRQTDGGDPLVDLVGFGFRGWFAGLAEDNHHAIAAVTGRYCGLLGLVQGQCVLAELQAWTQAVRRCARRPICLHALRCAQLSADERLAATIVAAAQHRACPAMRACGYALVETSDLGPMLECAERFADVLAQTEQFLNPAHIAPGIVPDMHSIKTLN